MRYLLIPLMFVSLFASAQLAVFDAGNAATLSQQLTQNKKQTGQAIQQTKAIKEQVSYIKKTTEFVSKVNAKLKTVYYLNQIQQSVTNTVNQSDASFKYLKESGEFSAQELAVILGNFTRLVVATNNIISLSNVIIKTTDLKMNDFERIERLDKANQEVLGLNMEVRSLNMKYTYILQQRQMRKAFKR